MCASGSATRNVTTALYQNCRYVRGWHGGVTEQQVCAPVLLGQQEEAGYDHSQFQNRFRFWLQGTRPAFSFHLLLHMSHSGSRPWCRRQLG